MGQKRRKQVRCTLCTSHRWKGNAADRLKLKDAAKLRAMQKEVLAAR